MLWTVDWGARSVIPHRLQKYGKDGYGPHVLNLVAVNADGLGYYAKAHLVESASVCWMLQDKEASIERISS